MPLLNIPKTYAAQRPPRTIDFDNFRLTLESFINSTRVDEDNLQVDAILQAFSSTQASSIIDASGVGDEQSGTGSVTCTKQGIYLIRVGEDEQTSIAAGGLTTSISTSITRSLTLNFSTLRSWGSTSIGVETSGSNLRSVDFGSNTEQVLIRSLLAGDVLTCLPASNTISLTLLRAT